MPCAFVSERAKVDTDAEVAGSEGTASKQRRFVLCEISSAVEPGCLYTLHLSSCLPPGERLCLCRATVEDVEEDLGLTGVEVDHRDVSVSLIR